MKDQYKTKKQLIEELEVLRNQLVGPKKAETKRKRVKEALQTTNERLNYLLTSTSAAIYTSKTSGDYGATSITENVKQMMGYEPREFIENSSFWIGHVHPEDRQRLLNELPRIFEQESYIYEYRFLHKDGNYRWVCDDMKLIKDEFGSPIEIIGYWTDITERKQAEEKLKESERRFRIIFEGAIDGILLADIETKKFHTGNMMICTMLGYSLEEIKNLSVTDIHPKEALPFVMEQFDKLARGEITKTSELPVKRKDGSVFYAEISTVLLKLDGETYLMGSFRDITERKRAEEAVREGEERFRLAFENANTGVCLVDLDGNLLRVNNKMCEIFGYTKEELERMTVNNIAHPEDIDVSPAFIKKTLRGETDRGTFEKRYFHKKGHTVTCQVSSSLVRDAEGSPLYFISHVHDITERKQAEEALRQSEERYRTILEDIEEGYFEVDLTGRSTFVNDSLCRIHGYPREELLGIDNRRFVDKENAKKAFEAFNRVYRTGEPGRLFDYEVIRKDGTKRQVEVFPSLRKDSSGNPIGFRGITRDVTERKQAEELLQKEREISLSILENAPYGVALIDEGGKYIYINPEFVNTTGYTLQDIPTGKDWFQKVFPDPKDRERMIQLWKEDRSKGNMTNKEFGITCKDGSMREIEIRSTFLRDSRAVIVLHDITERKRAEERMESLREQLRQSQKMEAIGRLAGGIAHDFNNLLTIIKGYSQLSLIELKENTPLRENIEHIHTATDRAADLVRQLLAFSRRQILAMRVLDLNTTLANLHNMLRRLIGEDIELTTVLAEDLGRVKTVLGWIEQAIMNLVVNARDAMPSGGKLTIETGNADLDDAYVGGHVGVKPGRYVVLSVSDTGVGMTPEVRERLFEPFFSTKEKDKGTGLGLSTVYGIVKQSDGDIWVYSEPGKGSTFKIYLPRVEEPLEQPREKVLGDELLRGNETILLVEDEEEVRKLAVRVLERQGYKVLAARDGDEALIICERHQDPIHLLLTDVVMPGMNGHEVAKRLDSLHPEMKVLYMSGYTDNAIVLHGVLVKGVNYIQKPFTVDALTKKVREVLEQ
jgi:two-component system cell cycle sensor histidine kinase/response regulator CckA